MAVAPQTECSGISPADGSELTKLVNTVALSDRTLILFAIAPESGPHHPVVKALRTQLSGELDQPLYFSNLFYSDDSLTNFLARRNQSTPSLERQVVFAFGLEQLPTPRKKQELEWLNLAREEIFEQNVVVVFWLNHESFLNEFRRLAPDFWDWRGNMAVFETRYRWLYPYLDWLISASAYLTTSGVTLANYQIDIDRIYVSLQAEQKQQTKTAAATAENAGPIETTSESIELSGVVQGHYACSVILGVPGAGKTTLLKYLALHFAKAVRDGQEIVKGADEAESVDLGTVRLPISFKIADYAEHLERNPELELIEYIQQFYRPWEDYLNDEQPLKSDISSFLLEQMHVGNCLILLDGLNEVFDQKSRKRIVKRIDSFAMQFGRNNKLIVTSRISGYGEAKLGNCFTEFTIAQMSDKQVNSFLYRWFQMIEAVLNPEAPLAQQRLAGNHQAERIIKEIRQNEGVRKLTTNPLLLTNLALIHQRGEPLPEHRVNLYELAVQTFVSSWQLHKKRSNIKLKESEVTKLLAPLAYWIHQEKPSGLATHAEVVQRLVPELASLRGKAPTSPEILQEVEIFLKKIRETTGLLIEREPGQYGFSHLTFEEYFAARDILANESTQIVDLIHAHISDPRWEEPTLLALGFLRSHQPTAFLIVFKSLFRELIQLSEEMRPQPPSGKLALTQRRLFHISQFSQHSQQVFQDPEFYMNKVLLAIMVLKDVALSTAQQTEIVCGLLAYRIVFEAIVSVRNSFDFIPGLIRKTERSFIGLKDVFAALEEAWNEEKLARRSFLHNPEVANAVIAYLKEISENSTLPVGIRVKTKKIFLDVFISDSDLPPDALHDIITDFKISKKDRANIYYQAGFAFQAQTSYKKAVRYYDESIELYGAIRKKKNVAKVLFLKSSCYREQGDYERAIEVMNQAIAIHTSARNKQKLAECYSNMGIVYQTWNNQEQAISYYSRSLEIYEKLRNKESSAAVAIAIARCHLEQGRYDDAELAAAKSLALSEAIGAIYKDLKSFYIYESLYLLGQICKYCDRYTEAIGYYERIIDFLEENGDTSFMVKYLPQMVRQSYEIRSIFSPEEIRDLVAETDELSWSARRFLVVSVPAFMIAKCYQDMGRYAEAIEHYFRLFEECERLDLNRQMDDACYSLSQCYSRLKQYDLAITCAQISVGISQSLQLKSGLAKSRNQLASVYKSSENYPEAIAQYEQNRDYYQQLDQKSNVAMQWGYIADCYSGWLQPEKAVIAVQHKLAIQTEISDLYSITLTHWQLGNIYYSWGKYEEAIAQYKQAQALDQRLGEELDISASLNSVLAICYRDWNQYEQAIEYQQQYLASIQLAGKADRVALAYHHLGYMHQAWSKPEAAIACYEKSRNLYQQLEDNVGVASQWQAMADCYSDGHQHEQAVECQRKCVVIKQKNPDIVAVAYAFYQLGHRYQTWGKYEDAIAQYQESRDRYKQSDLAPSVATLWDAMADCYRHWGKDEQAVAAEQKALAIREKLDSLETAA